MNLSERTLHELLEAYSAPAVAPAGISAGALGSAVGAALILKVANITTLKLPPGPERETAQMVASKVERLRNMLEDIVNQDAEAYTKLVRVKAAHAKGLESDDALQRALKTVTLIPGAMGRASMICINLAASLVDIAYRPAMFDLVMGAWLCYAGVETSLLAVDYNLGEIADVAFCEKIRSKLDFFDNRASTMGHIEWIAKQRKGAAQAVGGNNAGQSESRKT